MKKILLILFLTSFVSAIETNFDCPKSVIADEEFSCYLFVKDIEGVYDVKVEIMQDSETLAEIFDPKKEKWQSAYYYLKEFIKEEEKKEILLKIEKEGKFNGILKLRKGNTREFFDFEIEATKGFSDDKENFDPPKIEEQLIENLSNKNNLIPLNNLNENNPEKQLIYESKNYKVIKFLPYVFSFLLIFIIAVLIWGKF